MADPKAPVPKFASFRPKNVLVVKPVDDNDEPRSKREGDERMSKKRERGHEYRHNHDRRKHERRHKRDRNLDQKKDRREGSASQTIVKVDSQQLSKELLENASDVYRIDRKGDPDNLRYRTLHSYGVPQYRRIGYGAVLGAPRDARIDRSNLEDKGIVLVKREREGRAIRSLLQKPRAPELRKLRLIRSNAADEAIDHSENFIELPRSGRRKRGSESPAANHGEVDYRSIEGKAKALQNPEDPDMEYASSSDDSVDDEDGGRAARLHNAELTRRSREHPQDLTAWQSLIEHQRSVLGFSLGEISLASTRTLADIRISIYEEALKAVQDPGNQATLTLGMLKEGAKLWEVKKLAEHWEQALWKYSKESSIWTAYLEFVQGSHAEFRYERCKDEYIKCLDILGQQMPQEHEPLEAMASSRILIHVFLRFTSMVRDAGYHELAEALWQALLELHFFRSSELQGRDAIAASIEEFWESEVPRIGEEGARGWFNYSPEQQDSVEPVTIEVELIKSTRRLFAKFAEAEKQTAKLLAHPGRSADEAGEDDLYHPVLFNDLKPILFPHLVRIEDKTALIMAFLRFLNLPPLPWPSDRHYESWWLDPMLSSRMKSGVLLPHHQITTDTLFSNDFTNINLDDVDWTTRALRSLVDACPHNDLVAEYYIALEYHVNSANAAKVAKRLLKSRSSSLRLYNAYAIIECRNKGLDTGSRTFSTAISMAGSLRNDQRRLRILLDRTWIWEALRTGDLQIATEILMSIGSGAGQSGADSASPAVELRVTRWLRDGRDAMLLANETNLAVLYAELLALVAYIRHGKSIQAAFNVFAENERILTERSLTGSPVHEHLHQTRAQLLAFHLKHVHIYQPALIRATLAESITLFSKNTIFLIAYNSLSPEVKLHGSRSLLEEVVLAEGKDTIIGWCFTLHTTLQRGLELGGTAHAARAIFERAIARVGRPNLHIWNAYLLFECEQQDYKKAKAVFLRGLRELPWSKWWVVLGLERLADVVGFEDGRRVWRVLGERELRVHVDVEELVEAEWKRRQEERGGGMLG